MISPAFYTIACYQGATFNKVFTWEVDAVPVNLTGYTARMQVRSTKDSATTIVSLTTGSGITLGGAAGTITLDLSATATAALPSGVYLYDLELVSGGGQVTRLLEGKFTISAEVTR